MGLPGPYMGLPGPHMGLPGPHMGLPGALYGPPWALCGPYMGLPGPYMGLPGALYGPPWGPGPGAGGRGRSPLDQPPTAFSSGQRLAGSFIQEQLAANSLNLCSTAIPPAALFGLLEVIRSY